MAGDATRPGRTGSGPGAGAFVDDEPVTRRELSRETSWGRCASVIADLGDYDARQCVDLVVAWANSGPDQRVLISALAKMLSRII